MLFAHRPMPSEPIYDMQPCTERSARNPEDRFGLTRSAPRHATRSAIWSRATVHYRVEPPDHATCLGKVPDLPRTPPLVRRR